MVKYDSTHTRLDFLTADSESRTLSNISRDATSMCHGISKQKGNIDYSCAGFTRFVLPGWGRGGGSLMIACLL